MISFLGDTLKSQQPKTLKEFDNNHKEKSKRMKIWILTTK
jgi:hypothetical protein